MKLFAKYLGAYMVAFGVSTLIMLAWLADTGLGAFTTALGGVILLIWAS